MKLCKNFWLHEFIPPEIYEMSLRNSTLFIDQRLVKLVQFIRDRFNKPITINDWMDGGTFINSGYRSLLCEVGAHFSQHKFGRATDLKIDGVSPEEARRDIIANWNLFKEKTALTTLEAKTPTWLHVDVRFTNMEHLLIINP